MSERKNVICQTIEQAAEVAEWLFNEGYNVGEPVVEQLEGCKAPMAVFYIEGDFVSEVELYENPTMRELIRAYRELWPDEDRCTYRKWKDSI